MRLEGSKHAANKSPPMPPFPPIEPPQSPQVLWVFRQNLLLCFLEIARQHTHAAVIVGVGYGQSFQYKKRRRARFRRFEKEREVGVERALRARASVVGRCCLFVYGGCLTIKYFVSPFNVSQHEWRTTVNHQPFAFYN